jgi:pimeloyl-ACP methyl ester carboxylesterase
MQRTRVLRAAVLAAALTVVATPAGAGAATGKKPSPGGATLSWGACADGAPGWECATASVPRDYGQPRGTKWQLAVTRLPARDDKKRIGSLFVNFGGPGGDAVESLHAFGGDLFHNLNERFDIVGFDPRGVGESRPAIDCHANQETEGIYSKPFATPFNLDTRAFFAKVTGYQQKCLQANRDVFPWVSTANVARDMDLLRGAVGDQKLNYLGFSYGTFLGATYASLFPHRYRALVLDGPLDPNQYINKPEAALREQSAGFERAIGRFLQACAADQAACHGFGAREGDDPDPWDAYDQLVDELDAHPRDPGDGRVVTGDDLNFVVTGLVYAKQLWPAIAEILAATQAGDATVLRGWADAVWGRNDDGTYDPGTDRYFTLSASEQRYSRDAAHYLDAGDNSWGMFDHAWWNTGYVELNWGLWPVRDRDAYYGPFRAAGDETPPLVVATTYDPATPYRGALRLVRQLGNAKLLTMRGDGHTAYGGNSPCIDAAVEAYLNDLATPAVASCRQQVPFDAPEQAAANMLAPATHRSMSTLERVRRLGPGVSPAAAGI